MAEIGKEGSRVKQGGVERYFGWVIVITAAVITLLTVGLRLGIGPFVKPIMLDLAISRTDLSIIVAISMIGYGVGMPIAGMLLKRYSTRFVLLVGVILICGSILWTFFSHGMVSFLFSFGIFLSIGLSFTSPVAMTPIISRWFIRQRGKALFYLSTGSMAGIAVVTPLETLLIEAIGWRQTLLTFAGLFICIVIPAAVFIMRDEVPEGADQGKSGLGAAAENQGIRQLTLPEITWHDALRTRAYWQIIMGFFACGFSMNLLGSHAVPMLMDHHFEPMTASFGVGLIGIVAIFSTLLMGSIADRYPRKNILFWIYLIRGLGFLGLVFAAKPWQLYLVAATGGLVWSGSAAMTSAILGDLFGVRLLGGLYGWAYFGHQIGGAFGSFLGGYGYEIFGTHIFSFGLTTILLLIAGWVSFHLPTQISFPQKEQKNNCLQTGQ